MDGSAMIADLTWQSCSIRFVSNVDEQVSNKIKSDRD